MKRGVPADVLVARIGFLMRQANDYSFDPDRVKLLMAEAQDLLGQLREGL